MRLFALLVLVGILSACGGTPDPDRAACESLANYVNEGRPATARADLLDNLNWYAEDEILRSRADALASSPSQEAFDMNLDRVAARCLDLRDSRNWKAVR